MIKRRARIQPADEAKLYIASASDKPGLMQRFINADKVAKSSVVVGTEEFPAARVESSTALIEEISRDQDGSIQVGTEEFPAARVESSTALIEEISRDQDGSIQDGVPNVPDPLYDSNESIVKESDDEVVPKLRRTKSILMERLPLSDALFDSSDDTTEDLSTSKSDRASERQRRYCYPSLVGTDNTSGESEEEYVPNPNEESTDSDGSSELSVKSKDEKKTAPHSQSARKSLTKTSFVSRSQGKRVLKTSFENRSQESVDMDSFLQEGMEDADLPKEQEKECDLTSPQEGKKAVIKRSWTEESAAVNKHLRKFIVMNQVPGKEDCERCIAAEPDALRTRDWKAVKYFIKNRITALGADEVRIVSAVGRRFVRLHVGGGDDGSEGFTGTTGRKSGLKRRTNRIGKMIKRRARIQPADEAKIYIASASDKPGLMQRFINADKVKEEECLLPSLSIQGLLYWNTEANLYQQKNASQGSTRRGRAHFCLNFSGKINSGEFPAARVESSTALIEEISRDQDGSIQVGTEEFPAARVESSTALIEEISRDQDGSIQIAVIQGISLVNYSESESDEDSVKNCSITPHSDDVLQTDSRKKTILDGVPNVPDPLYDSNESIVEESDDEVVPKLRRTKSILMERLPLSDALFDSSDDTTEDLSTSKSDRASERQRRYCYPSLVGTDNTSGESEEEYVPNPNEESTDSDGSSELSVKESVDMDSFLQEGMEDADLPKEQEKECDLTSPQEDTDIPETHGSEDEVDVRSLQECSSTANELTLKRSVKKRGKKAVIKRSWTPEESAAVNKHMRKFIVMNQVPGKEDCERCIAAEPDALRTRDWKAVKYFIKNRITAVRRKLESVSSIFSPPGSPSCLPDESPSDPSSIGIKIRTAGVLNASEKC
ncbi:hypothetical protein DNTS_021273 [Danionella cerebrum]|uniref:Uncharacterized protein n=1 Tax=Danionella cerebrum TaxID=2873325 RepID=A0A553MM75_9TELE|nr:hypothetical protein DNTS_021273 [Danionella translucida]